jgi:hypothetical protein
VPSFVVKQFCPEAAEAAPGLKQLLIRKKQVEKLFAIVCAELVIWRFRICSGEEGC